MSLVRTPSGGKQDVINDNFGQRVAPGVGVAHVRLVGMLEAEIDVDCHKLVPDGVDSLLIKIDALTFVCSNRHVSNK